MAPGSNPMHTPSTLFSICVVEIETIILMNEKRTKINKKRQGLAHLFFKKTRTFWVVVVAELVEWLLPTPEVLG